MTLKEQTEHEAILLKHAHEQSVALESVKAALAEIERLNKIIHYWGRIDKELCARAADALDCHNLDHLQDDLIKDLRKAAE